MTRILIIYASVEQGVHPFNALHTHPLDGYNKRRKKL